MPLTVPSSSPTCADVSSSLESLRSSQLSLPQLPYRNRLEAPTNRPKKPTNDQIRPSSPIALYDSLDTNLLEAFNHLDEDIKLSRVKDKLASEGAVNKAFLQENLSIYSDSDSNSNSSSETNSHPNSNDPDSDDKNSDNEDSNDKGSNDKGSNDKDTLQYPRSNFRISSCNSSYA